WVANDGTYEYDGPILLFGGPSAESKANEAAQTAFYQQTTQQQQQIYGEQQQLYNTVIGATAPIIAKGPQQYGYTPEVDALLRSTITDTANQATANAITGTQLREQQKTGGTDVLGIARGGLAAARKQVRDTVILDTAGRLTVDVPLMKEIADLSAAVKASETLLVVDAMTGQEAVNVAEAFHAAVPVTGLVLTKIDGDARGGAALSISAVTGLPVKFMGTGEKTDALEPFHPDRLAGRILGMGDVLTLVERAQEHYDEKEAAKMAEKLRKNSFTLEDMLNQMEQVRKMGPMGQIMEMIPGMGGVAKEAQAAVDRGDLKRVEAIIRSMTPDERREPTILNAARRRRIARGSGTRLQDVNQLVKQFGELKKMMKQMTGGRLGRRMPGMLG
ncbi:MAG: hypothetical protein ABSB75_07695, partial [Candidatus Limnocylindrales bacterium]